MRCTFIIFFAALSIATEGRTFRQRTMERRSATCSPNGKEYNSGDQIVYHNVTTPVASAMCTLCDCSAGSIDNCNTYYCDIGLGFPIDACEVWSTGVEGVCCPKCECVNDGEQKSIGDTWVRRTSSHCYECSCNESSGVDCNMVQCLSCSGVAVAVAGQCCPKCQTTTTPDPVFTISLTTTQSPPVFPPGFGPWK